MHDAAAAALSYLDSLDPALAADARTGWDGLLDASPLSGPTQTSVQAYVWAHLRRRFATPAELWDIACALGVVLERVGHVRYAEIARGKTTRALLFIGDETLWQQAYLEALHDAGTAPEDTELVTWQDNPVGDEQAIIDHIGETLEVATVAGEFDPPLAKATVAERRHTLTDGVLRTEKSGTSLLQVLLEHRIALWSSYSAPRAELYLGLSDRFHDRVPVDLPTAYGCTSRLTGLLELIGDGVALTDNGKLPPGFIDEDHAVETLRRLLMKLRLVRKKHGQLLPTRFGRGIIGGANPELAAWALLVDKLVGVEYRPEAAAAEAVLARVARGGNVASGREELHHFIESLLDAEGWTHGGYFASDTVVIPLADTVVDHLTALGAVTVEGSPTEPGRALAVAILRHRLLHSRFPTI